MTNLKRVMFLRRCKDGQFCCGYNILAEGVFVAQLCCSVGIPVWRIVWVTTNCCLVSDILCCCCCCLLLSSLPGVVSEFHSRDSHFRYRVGDGLSWGFSCFCWACPGRCWAGVSD